MIGEIQLAAGGRPFGFESLDLLKSVGVLRIPYEFIGMSGTAERYRVSGALDANDLTFRTAINPHSSVPVSTVLIKLTNVGGGFVLVDNIRLRY